LLSTATDWTSPRLSALREEPLPWVDVLTAPLLDDIGEALRLAVSGADRHQIKSGRVQNVPQVGAE